MFTSRHTGPQDASKRRPGFFRSAWRIAQFCSGPIPTQSGKRGRGGLRRLEMLRRTPCLHRGSSYPPRERQSDVTGTFSAPVTSLHFKSSDVMTSPCCVYAGSETVLSFNSLRKCHHTSVRPSTSGQHLGKVPGAVYEATDLHYIIEHHVEHHVSARTMDTGLPMDKSWTNRAQRLPRRPYAIWVGKSFP